jgi:hypothetical protein
VTGGYSQSVITAPRWEHCTDHPTVALATAPDGGVAVLFEDGSLDLLRSDGARSGELQLPCAARASDGDDGARSFAKLRSVGGAWLASMPGQGHLVRHADGRNVRAAAGDDPVEAFAIAGEQLAVARCGSLELWTLADQRRWAIAGGPFVAVTFAGRTLVALRGDGELVFLSLLKGAIMGTLKLAAAEPAVSWHLATIDGARVALGFGEWLVVVDAASHKVVRRTRVRGDIVALAATERRMIVGLEDGWLQAFDAFTGEPRGSVQAHERDVVALAMGGGVIFSAARVGPVRAWDEAAVETAARAGSPVTSLACRATFVAVGDRAGRLRLLKGVEEVGALRLDGPISGTHVGADDSVIAAAGSVLVCLSKPWKTPRPVLLRSSSTALAVDAAYAFVGNEQGSVDVYDLERGAHVTSYALSEASVSALVRLPGAQLVVGTGALDGRLFIVDVAQAKVLHRIEAHQEAFGVTSLAAEPRGRIVASGSDDGTIALIDPSKGRVLARVRVPETPTSLAFDGTGRKLAAVLADGSTLVVAIDQRAAVTPLACRKAAHLAWGDALVIGLADGRIERVA